MNPIQKALAQADAITEANAELERITRRAAIDPSKTYLTHLDGTTYACVSGEQALTLIDRGSRCTFTEVQPYSPATTAFALRLAAAERALGQAR